MLAIDKVAAQSIRAATCNLNSTRIFSWEQLNTAAYIAQEWAPPRALKALDWVMAGGVWVDSNI